MLDALQGGVVLLKEGQDSRMERKARISPLLSARQSEGACNRTISTKKNVFIGSPFKRDAKRSAGPAFAYG
jgi:hypothetical protein